MLFIYRLLFSFLSVFDPPATPLSHSQGSYIKDFSNHNLQNILLIFFHLWFLKMLIHQSLLLALDCEFRWTGWSSNPHSSHGVFYEICSFPLFFYFYFYPPCSDKRRSVTLWRADWCKRELCCYIPKNKSTGLEWKQNHQNILVHYSCSSNKCFRICSVSKLFKQ